jgi:hypothetical protein
LSDAYARWRASECDRAAWGGALKGLKCKRREGVVKGRLERVRRVKSARTGQRRWGGALEGLKRKRRERVVTGRVERVRRVESARTGQRRGMRRGTPARRDEKYVSQREPSWHPVSTISPSTREERGNERANGKKSTQFCP